MTPGSTPSNGGNNTPGRSIDTETKFSFTLGQILATIFGAAPLVLALIYAGHTFLSMKESVDELTKSTDSLRKDINKVQLGFDNSAKIDSNQEKRLRVLERRLRR